MLNCLSAFVGADQVLCHLHRFPTSLLDRSHGGDIVALTPSDNERDSAFGSKDTGYSFANSLGAAGDDDDSVFKIQFDEDAPAAPLIRPDFFNISVALAAAADNSSWGGFPSWTTL